DCRCRVDRSRSAEDPSLSPVVFVERVEVSIPRRNENHPVSYDGGGIHVSPGCKRPHEVWPTRCGRWSSSASRSIMMEHRPRIIRRTRRTGRKTFRRCWCFTSGYSYAEKVERKDQNNNCPSQWNPLAEPEHPSPKRDLENPQLKRHVTHACTIED